ncbi:MAG: histidinol phosphate phosphatase, partial [Treponema sp.]|nr:histidinol phosphate phosphatase [Treponema sp.]
AVDGKPEDIKTGIDKLFNKNAKKAVCEYFYLQREMIKKCDFTILGHPDLFRKENERLNLFNESDSWYKNEIKALAKEIAKKGIITEVNTGAITRKKMNDVYPSAFFLNLLKEYNVPITISSDAHSANDLDGAFETAIDTIKKAGYSEVAYLNSSCKIQFQKI